MEKKMEWNQSKKSKQEWKYTNAHTQNAYQNHRNVGMLEFKIRVFIKTSVSFSVYFFIEFPKL